MSVKQGLNPKGNHGEAEKNTPSLEKDIRVCELSSSLRGLNEYTADYCGFISHNANQTFTRSGVLSSRPHVRELADDVICVIGV